MLRNQKLITLIEFVKGFLKFPTLRFPLNPYKVDQKSKIQQSFCILHSLKEKQFT